MFQFVVGVSHFTVGLCDCDTGDSTRIDGQISDCCQSKPGASFPAEYRD